MNKNDWTVREDEFSWQLLGPNKLFVRITSSKFDRKSMVFSDFIVHNLPRDDVQLVFALVSERFGELKSGMQLVFQDVLPGPKTKLTLQNRELVRRHDQITECVRLFGQCNDFTISNSMLNPRADKFDTIIFLS